jgi:putative nucleotidyltransferase with HDIG domain
MESPDLSASIPSTQKGTGSIPLRARYFSLIHRLVNNGYLIAVAASLTSVPVYYLLHPYTGHGEWVFALAVIAVSTRKGIGPGMLAAGLNSIEYGLITYGGFPHEGALQDMLFWLGFYTITVFMVGTLVRRREAALLARARMGEELEKTSATTLFAMTRALDARDRDTEGHSERVATLAVKIGHELGMEEAALHSLSLAALLHDIGKIGVPDAILHKPGALNEAEWAFIRKHPQTGYDILKNIPFLEPALDGILQHHEKFNGKGYPGGLNGDAISLPGRILAVVDVYDALTSNRPYRPAYSSDKALEIMRSESGQQFDPEIIKALLRMTEIKKEKIQN